MAPWFARWRAAGHTALIPYMTAGYPRPADTPGLLAALAGAGADIIELGVPFSDPVADGPTIQRASQRALEQGVTLASVLAQLTEFRARHDTPVVLFSYLNPLLSYGVERFCAEAVAAGAHGLLLTDLPVGGDPELEGLLEAAPLALVRLIAPTTPPARALLIAARAQGFVYYIARLGVTGAGRELRPELVQELRALRQRTTTPLAVGFGVSTPAHAALLAAEADGVVVGSALIDALDRGGIPAAAAFLAELRRALG
ncbi:MAG: tryptophan synthase subunit alpha [Gemmatimonadetes bacterium]|nr:tryptophan synthase subunit alpha [Gemmatimonadota bacterium]